MIVCEAVDAIRPSVVQIVTEGRILGTGFFVSEDADVVTAQHVINAIPAANLQVGIASPNIDTPQVQARANFNMVSCEVVDQDERNDIVLLRLNQNPFQGQLGVFAQIGEQQIGWLHAVPALNTDRPCDGAQIAVSGYPLSNPALLTNAGYVASAWAQDSQNIQVPGGPAGFMLPDFKDIYIADMRVNPGNSGGPIYLVETAEIIGVCVSHSMAPVYNPNANGQLVPTRINNVPLLVNAGIANIIPAKYLVELMGRNNIERA